MQDRVYIILVNWNGWRDTIECLETVFRLTGVNYTVVVCDNASTDGSVANICRWATGELAAECRNSYLADLSSPPVSKPLKHVVIDRRMSSSAPPSETCLILVQIDANLGFAAANNIGIRIALAQPEAAYIWLLNNDTVVRPNALSALIDRTKHDSNVGLCGSTLLFYDRPEYIQACGGARYNPWTSRGGHIAAGQEASSLPSAELVEKRLRYIVGASILASRAFVEVVGLMNENYFLYCEEVDWATRAKGRFSLAYAPKSVVYHKVGASIGSAARSLYQSEMADFWGTRNRVAFTREHHWYALPTVYCFVLASAALRFLHGRAKNGVAVMLGAFRRTIPQRWDVAGRPLG